MTIVSQSSSMSHTSTIAHNCQYTGARDWIFTTLLNTRNLVTGQALYSTQQWHRQVAPARCLARIPQRIIIATSCQSKHRLLHCMPLIRRDMESRAKGTPRRARSGLMASYPRVVSVALGITGRLTLTMFIIRRGSVTQVRTAARSSQLPYNGPR